MTTTQSLPAQIAAAKNSAQYSLPKILGIWASVTVPMAVLAFVVAPAIMPHTSLHPGLVHWIAMVVGMMWQFVVSLAMLRHELGGLRWAAVKERIWLNVPRDPRTGSRDADCSSGSSGDCRQRPRRVPGPPARHRVDRLAAGPAGTVVRADRGASRPPVPGRSGGSSGWRW